MCVAVVVVVVVAGGNDFEIFTSSEVIGHTVTCPEDTVRQVNEVLSKD